MSELTAAQKEHYIKQANNHADFLCEKVFKPAFIMAFIHGVKHGREDLKKERSANCICPSCIDIKCGLRSLNNVTSCVSFKKCK